MQAEPTKNISGTIDDPELIAEYGRDRLELVERILQKAHAHGIKIATVESVTRGKVFDHLTCIVPPEGVLGFNVRSSGFSAYGYREKLEFGVDPRLLHEKSPVCAEVVRQMALQGLHNSDANLVVATTGFADERGDPAHGIAGGTVFIATAFQPFPSQEPMVKAECQQFSGARSETTRSAVGAALKAIERAIDDHILRKERLAGRYSSRSSAMAK